MNNIHIYLIYYFIDSLEKLKEENQNHLSYKSKRLN
jgi:hypothetical protein